VGVDSPAPSNGGRSTLACPELEFFLLSIVVEHYEPLWILDTGSLGEAVNRHVPDFTREELVDTLSDLFRCGDLTAHLGGTSRLRGGDLNLPYGMTHHSADSRPFCPNRDEIDGALCGALNLDYGLTPQGGARWEAMAQFDWNYHLGEWFDDGFEGPSREMIEVYLTYDRCAVAGSEQWSTVRPWKATYWKSIPEGVRVRYQDAPDGVRFAHDWRYGNPGGLWLDSWNERRQANMRIFIPMGPARSEIVADRPWRIKYRSVERRSTPDLLRLLNDADFAIQYAAGMRLSGLDDPSVAPALIEWFLKRPARFSLRVVSRLDTLPTLDALIDILKTKNWKDDWRNDTFQRDLGLSIGRFGARSLPGLAPLLGAEGVHTQMATLRALGETGTVEAGALILDWLHTHKADESAEGVWLVQRALLSLGRLGHANALPLLKEIFSGKAPSAVSRSAIEALALFNQSDARNLLEKFVRSGGKLYARRYALSHLVKADPSFREECEHLNEEIRVDTLRGETIVFLRGNPALDVPDPIAALTGTLNDPDPMRRVSAITLICRHKGAFPAERVVGLLNDTEPEVRANAVVALGLRGSGSDACKIQPLTHDSSGLVRYCAREALIRLNV